MTRRIVDDSGILPETWEFDAHGELTGIGVSMDVENLIGGVSEIRGNTGGKSKFGWHIGRLPMTAVIEHAKVRGISAGDLLYKPEYGAELVALCQSSDYRHFSPTEGKA